MENNTICYILADEVGLGKTIEAIKKQRISTVLNANSDMIYLYWNIGKAILKKQGEEGWGAKIIDRMAKDLKDEFPEMSGFSPRNIKYMRKFAECWSDFEIVQRVVAQISWRTNRMLLDKLDNQESRIWYAYKRLENGWSSAILDSLGIDMLPEDLKSSLPSIEEIENELK